jgi:hypothetical protein
MENTSINNPDSTGPTPEIRDFRFLTEDRDDQFAIEFVLNNPSADPADRLLINRASIGYWDRNNTLFLCYMTQPGSMYELAIHITSVITGPDPINGTSETRMERESSGSGAFHLWGGQISVDFYFPLWLQVEPGSQKTVRIIATKPQMLGGAYVDEQDVNRFVEAMGSIASSYDLGNFTLTLEGYYWEPIKVEVKDNRFLNFVTRIITSG